MNMNISDCESLFNESMRTEIKNKFYESDKNKIYEYYGIMNNLNTFNSCGTFLKIYRNTVVLNYIDDNINKIKLKYEKCYSTEIANIDDIRRKLINYYKCPVELFYQIVRIQY